MLIVNLDPKTLVTDIEKNKKGISVVDASYLDLEMDYTEDTWLDFFSRMGKEFPDLRELPLHIITDAKMGVLYKTFSVTIDVFADIERQRKQAGSAEEQRNILNDFLLKQLPIGLDEHYVASIPRSVSRPQDVLVTCAYVPGDLINSLITAANKFGIQVFDIVPGLRALYGAFDSNSALGFEFPASSVLLMHYGALIWTRPDNWAEEDDYCIDEYFKEKLSLFDLGNMDDAVMITPQNMAHYLNPIIKRDSLNCVDDVLTAAMCCGAATNPAYQDKKEASYVLNRIRKFFK